MCTQKPEGVAILRTMCDDHSFARDERHLLSEFHGGLLLQVERSAGPMYCTVCERGSVR